MQKYLVKKKIKMFHWFFLLSQAPVWIAMALIAAALMKIK